MKRLTLTFALLMAAGAASASLAATADSPYTREYRNTYWYQFSDMVPAGPADPHGASSLQDAVDRDLAQAWGSDEYQTSADGCPVGPRDRDARALAELEQLQERSGLE